MSVWALRPLHPNRAKEFPDYPAESKLITGTPHSLSEPRVLTPFRTRDHGAPRLSSRPALPDLGVRFREPCTWSELKGKQRRRKHRPRFGEDEDSDSGSDHDPLSDTLAIPQPKNFLHGTLVKKLRKPDPTPQQLEEYWVLKTTKEWRETKHAFIK